MIDEGYTKFRVAWTDHNPIAHPAVALLERWRRPLFEAGLVGHYADLGIGYGNISMRVDDGDSFVISGTQTGHLPRTGNEHYALVTETDIADNSVTCRGATQASSESLTHAAIYRLDPSIGAVVHVHSETLWEQLKDAVPTTGTDVPYGTPAMAREFARLYRETALPETGIAVMAGHEGGLVSIGGDIGQAATRILSIHEQYAIPTREVRQ